MLEDKIKQRTPVMSQSLADKYAHTSGKNIIEDDPRFQKQASYQAYSVDKSKNRQFRIDIRQKDGSGYSLSYSYLTRIMYTANQNLSLIFTDCIITLKGSRLSELKDLLHDEKIRYVQEFNPVKFTAPQDNEPIIRDIEIIEMHSLMISPQEDGKTVATNKHSYIEQK